MAAPAARPGYPFPVPPRPFHRAALQQAKALHTIKKAYRKGLHKKVLHRSRLGSQAAGQDFYIIKIHLTITLFIILLPRKNHSGYMNYTNQ